MKKLNLSLFQFHEIMNLKLGCYYPVKEFMDKKEFLSVLKSYKLKNNFFFPMPIFMDIGSEQKKKINNEKQIKLFYNKKLIGLFTDIQFYKLDKKNLLKSFFKTKNTDHPGVKNFLATKDFFINGKIKLSNDIMYNKKNYPEYWKNLFKKKGIKKIGSFHTRNIPHKTHEWIIDKIIKKCGYIFIHPMTGKLKKGDFKSSIIAKAYKIFKRVKDSPYIFINEFKSHARYAGPREAIFHAIVRKNFGCSHFYVGRDHAGVKNFYKKYESQKICKRYQKKIEISILSFQEPGYCVKCKKVTGRDDKCNHSKEYKKFLSGTKLRNLILANKQIPEFFVRKEIAKYLESKSIRNF